ncbi:hypothetical protein [Rhizorhabdus histidinilytica]|jgi:hypothetical protein|uniref:hypothetical protein n=1 Tax=Rhizorhabdus histidinilytica TaxID=439228 RepID=UPI001ADA82C7|nr:hypothetical protein [Rhizorhabdus histidinilytica]
MDEDAHSVCRAFISVLELTRSTPFNPVANGLRDRWHDVYIIRRMCNRVRADDPFDKPTQNLRCIAGKKRMHDHAIRSREPHADQLARRLGEGPTG